MRPVRFVGGALPVLALAACQSPRRPTPDYFGQAEPGTTPVVFAPELISQAGRFEQFFLYSPDGTAAMLGVTNAAWDSFPMLYFARDGGRWSDPRPAPFLGDDADALTVSLSGDGKTAFFTASRPTYPPTDVWVSELRGDRWGEPRKIGPPVSSQADEFEVSVSDGGTLYFSSARKGGLGDLDIYRAPRVDGKYPAAQNLGPVINSSTGDDLPFVAPDESYLIFASDRPGGFGDRDLYLSFRAGDGWTEPQNLGSPINSAAWELYPSVSPDGRFLFFTRREGGWQPTRDSDIYWVSTEFIPRLRHSAVARASGSGPRATEGSAQ